MKKFKIITEKLKTFQIIVLLLSHLNVIIVNLGSKLLNSLLYFHCRLSLIFSIIGHSEAPEGRGYLRQ